MRAKRNHYKEMEQSMVMVLLADIVQFIFFLIASANGIEWLRITFFILTLLMALLCLVLLCINGEIIRQRSMWLTFAFTAITVCSLVAFLLNYPSPDPYANQSSTTEPTSATTPETTASTNPTTTQ